MIRFCIIQILNLPIRNPWARAKPKLNTSPNIEPIPFFLSQGIEGLVSIPSFWTPWSFLFDYKKKKFYTDFQPISPILYIESWENKTSLLFLLSAWSSTGYMVIQSASMGIVIYMLLLRKRRKTKGKESYFTFHVSWPYKASWYSNCFGSDINTGPYLPTTTQISKVARNIYAMNRTDFV